jgi:hypothetical protein
METTKKATKLKCRMIDPPNSFIEAIADLERQEGERKNIKRISKDKELFRAIQTATFPLCLKTHNSR